MEAKFHSRAVWTMLACIVTTISGCSEPSPAAKCSVAEAQRGYLDSVYATLGEFALRENSSPTSHKDMQALVSALRKSSFINIEAITAERYDPSTGNLECRAELTMRPDKSFGTQSVQNQASQMEQLRSESIFPVGFFEGKAAPMQVIFQLRTDGAGKLKISGADGFRDVVSLSQELLNARSLSDAVLAANPGTKPDFKVLDTFAQKLPRTGQCFETKVYETGFRLEGAPESGTTVTFADGRYMIDYESSPIASSWSRGDPVKLCVVSVPTDCPAGDNRGVVYKALNLRTRNEWTAADSQHKCGGA